MPTTFNAVFLEVSEGYVGFVEELPGANAQGETLDEARESLREAIALVLDANRTFADQAIGDRVAIRETLSLHDETNRDLDIPAP